MKFTLSSTKKEMDSFEDVKMDVHPGAGVILTYSNDAQAWFTDREYLQSEVEKIERERRVLE